LVEAVVVGFVVVGLKLELGPEDESARAKPRIGGTYLFTRSGIIKSGARGIMSYRQRLHY